MYQHIHNVNKWAAIKPKEAAVEEFLKKIGQETDK